jgi:phenylalanyl-tRNA synthetase beta chain
MKFSVQWLNEWVNPELSLEALADQLTMAGLEVDALDTAAPDFTKVVVGSVLQVSPHPDADRLKVCSVDVGEATPLEIVCGARNVAVGMKVAVALVGARLPGGKIKKGKLRGVTSMGMLCAATELGLAESSEGIMLLPEDSPVGTDLRQLMMLDDDLIELDLTPNRGDCLSIQGIAREVGALNQSLVTVPEITTVAPVIDDVFAVKVHAPEICPVYMGRVIRQVPLNTPTPLWLSEKLRRSGVRSVSLLVDVTNYVMLELGQPMHAFDLAKLKGGLQVRMATANEPLTLLDGKNLTLTEETLVIADDSGALAIAGIMGGESSAVDDSTSDLFLESAFFNPVQIAGKARHYGLHTDSSHRFERGVDFFLQRQAIERVTALLLDIAGGLPGPVICESSSEHLPSPSKIHLRSSRCDRVLGFSVPEETIEDILSRLALSPEKCADGWQVTPPGFRFDLRQEADLIEEVGRVYGYNRIPNEAMNAALNIVPVPEMKVDLPVIQQVLLQRGYDEAITYSFISKELKKLLDPEAVALALANPISPEMAVMRTTLWAGLSQALQYNLNRQQARVRLFESGMRFVKTAEGLQQENMLSAIVSGDFCEEHCNHTLRSSDFFDVKADVESVLALTEKPYAFKADKHPVLHPGQSARIILDGEDIGWLGALHPVVCQKLDIPFALVFEMRLDPLQQGSLPRFKPLSKYPAIRRDLAVLVADTIPADALKQHLLSSNHDLLRSVQVFDVYQGTGVSLGKKSIALMLWLQDDSKTLTDVETETCMNQVLADLTDAFQAEMRV